jgi:nitrite reductase/ring-hydroxylating ferredoxin subunit
MSSTDEQTGGLSRREMIVRLMGAGCTACLGALSVSCPGGSSWGKPKQHSAAGEAQRLEFNTADVPLNSVLPIMLMGGPAFLVHYEAAGAEHWIALENKCTHKKSKLKFEASGHYFKCPLHKSEYSMDGSLRERENGKGWPAKRALMSWPVRIEGELAVITLDAQQAAAAESLAAELRPKEDEE